MKRKFDICKRCDFCMNQKIIVFGIFVLNLKRYFCCMTGTEGKTNKYFFGMIKTYIEKDILDNSFEKKSCFEKIPRPLRCKYEFEQNILTQEL